MMAPLDIPLPPISTEPASKNNAIENNLAFKEKEEPVNEKMKKAERDEDDMEVDEEDGEEGVKRQHAFKIAFSGSWQHQQQFEEEKSDESKWNKNFRI